MAKFSGLNFTSVLCALQVQVSFFIYTRIIQYIHYSILEVSCWKIVFAMLWENVGLYADVPSLQRFYLSYTTWLIVNLYIYISDGKTHSQSQIEISSNLMKSVRIRRKILQNEPLSHNIRANFL